MNASKGIIIATGGYEANPELRKAWLPHAEKFDTLTENKGEGILMGMWAGAGVDMPPHASNIHYDMGDNAWGLGLPWLRVDTDGNRMGNEDVAYGLLPMLEADRRDAWCFQILDSDFDQYYPKMIGNGGTGLFKGYPSAASKAEGIKLETSEDTSSWSDLKKIYENEVAKGHAYKADTLEDLAKAAGIDPEGLKATVDRYNELYEGGKDLDYGKKPDRMAAIKTAPFYAVLGKAYVLGTLGGLKINTNLQVLDTDGEVIPGLYAAGNASGGHFFGGVVQCMCAPAMTIGRAHTWGYLAAKNVVENEK